MSNYLCVSVTSTRLNCGIVNEKGQILNYHYMYFEDIPKEKNMVNLIERVSKSVSKGYNPTICTVAVPEIVDTVMGLWNSYKNGVGIPLRDSLQKRLGIPVFIDNDVNIAAIGEKYFGSMTYNYNFFYLNVSNGIGGAIFLNNRLYRGSHNGAGEVGHIPIEENGEKCFCGNEGCLETVASSVAIQKYYGKLTNDPNPPIYKEIAARARQGDISAVAVFSRAAYALGRTIATILNTTNITRFVIAGTVGMEFDLLEAKIYETISKYALKTPNFDFKITKTTIGYDATLIGCAAYCLIISNNPDIYAMLAKKGV